ncbi:MAG: 2-succinyl-5-enolpyruvyl-6-hydroxy-3-cyclohexene-1-carboxylic-acid synthase [Melioribacteraceae bacterium]|nr:2-succinyl-5-enolpyruvyl-6-hydroxy-3-cyclohexene-1-carboxylic-acid synthase [Melioribacteraceae bacterium]MCF8354821.1 2-succinyl-5-enolpyruvyl-6-hydroxy-3-cyclohexene-1-carboxylic-acid synthase [Melioribacteraceae bacterium]MCF8394548.1 2-succinyl-5-enolpyruvyl-6-hydroxy-3-cyclohexene-1-carboxylic-acid synthase [Melioribacteraceae bacterium]MCF8420207.1 2-succinyl-5-enolpyruvyl-6-hydroxy-3-cyclohexene-1-carboxylic-acid synthase [Melioribacteraceae bacterium]
MKKPVNHNIAAAECFVNQLASLGLKNAFISPGSRSTPLIFALQKNKAIKKHIIIDERSSGFFALGSAKFTNKPSLLITTSGTAVAELYPSIIEAYNSRIPLIVCTADRPHELKNTGANQTINQENIFKNHIRKFLNVDIRSMENSLFHKLKKDVINIYHTALFGDAGPVHINFMFDKPFEPDQATFNIDLKKLNELIKPVSHQIDVHEPKLKLNKYISLINKANKGIILCGPGNYSLKEIIAIIRLSKKTCFPILADGLSRLRFGNYYNANIISTHSSFLIDAELKNDFDADLILQFGSAPTTNSVLSYYEKSKAVKIAINTYGDQHDPSGTIDFIIKSGIHNFCEYAEKHIIESPVQSRTRWLKKFKTIERQTEDFLISSIKKTAFPFESRIYLELLNAVPEKSNLFIANSMPVRDWDFFACKMKKNIKVFSNRGASGIDGIISTAAGIAINSADPTFLVIGDLSMFHDTNGLWLLKNYRIPLNIILINNGGGGIFEMLPVSKFSEVHNEYFLTPIQVNFKKIITAFNGDYYLIKGWNDFADKISISAVSKNYSVMEIKTDSKKSTLLRKNIWNDLLNKIKRER